MRSQKSPKGQRDWKLEKMRYERKTPFANVWVVPKPAPKE
jgi:hypothetical protein